MRALVLIILSLFSLLTVVDSLNGALVLYFPGAGLSLSKFYKIGLLFLLLAYFVFYDRRRLLLAVGVLAVCAFSLLSIYAIEPGRLEIGMEAAFILKLVSPVISFLFFSSIVQQYFGKLKLLLFINLFVVAINLLIGITGIGRSQYTGGVGSIGFFIAGNELSGLMLILSSFSLYYIYLKHRAGYLIWAIALCILSLIKATKTAIFGQLIIIALIPLVAGGLVSMGIAKLQGVRVRLLSTVAFIFVLAATIFLVNSDLSGRWLEGFSNRDFITALTSSRDIYLSKSFEMVHDHFRNVNLLFGKGFGHFQQLMESYLGAPHMIEIDFFDIYYSYGIPMLVMTYGFYILVFLLALYRSIGSRRYPYAPLVALVCVVLTVISTLAGHIMTSGLCGLFLGLFFSLIYYEEDSPAQQLN